MIQQVARVCRETCSAGICRKRCVIEPEVGLRFRDREGFRSRGEFRERREFRDRDDFRGRRGPGIELDAPGVACGCARRASAGLNRRGGRRPPVGGPSA